MSEKKLYVKIRPFAAQGDWYAVPVDDRARFGDIIASECEACEDGGDSGGLHLSMMWMTEEEFSALPEFQGW